MVLLKDRLQITLKSEMDIGKLSLQITLVCHKARIINIHEYVYKRYIKRSDWE